MPKRNKSGDDVVPTNLNELFKYLLPEHKLDTDATVLRVINTIMYMCQVPEQLGGVPGAKYLHSRLGQSLLGLIMDFAGSGWSTLNSLLQVFQPHVQTVAYRILRAECYSLLKARKDLSLTIRNTGLSADDVYSFTQHPKFLEYCSVRNQLFGAGYAAVHLSFEVFVYIVRTRFVDFGFLNMIKGAIRVLPSRCALSSRDLVDIPQVSMSAIIVTWSPGMNMAVVVVNFKGTPLRFCSRLTKDGEQVTQEMYDQYVYAPNVHSVINTERSQLPDADLKLDSSNSTSAHGSAADTLVKVREELANTLTVPVGLAADINQVVVVYTRHHNQWNDEMAVNTDDGKCSSYADAGFGQHTGDMHKAEGCGLGTHDQILPLYTNHDACTGSYLKPIVSNQETFEAQIVDPTTPEYREYYNLVLNKVNDGRLAQARKALFQLPSSKLLLAFTTEPFANCGMYTIVTVSCRRYSENQSIVYVWGSPSKHSFNVATAAAYREWATRNLDPAATKGYPEYPKHLATVGRVPCSISADKLVELYTELLEATAKLLNCPDDEGLRQRVEELRYTLSGVIPLCNNPAGTKQDLYSQHGLKSTDVAYFEERSKSIEKMFAVAEAVSSVKAKFMTLSGVNVSAAGVAVEKTTVTSSSNRYRKHRF